MSIIGLYNISITYFHSVTTVSGEKAELYRRFHVNSSVELDLRSKLPNMPKFNMPDLRMNFEAETY